MISTNNKDLRISQKTQSIYELLDIESPLAMSVKAEIVASIIITMRQKQISVRYAALRAKITKKQLDRIISGSFHDTPVFRLKRITHRL